MGSFVAAKIKINNKKKFFKITSYAKGIDAYKMFFKGRG
jgi:hypothetical protein